jgi:hypothetical protein
MMSKRPSNDHSRLEPALRTATTHKKSCARREANLDAGSSWECFRETKIQELLVA